jgi:tetratricopeptide (TPR) repeat protein
VLTGFLILARASLDAHNGLTEQIAALTAQIVRSSGSAELLVRRAELYRFDHMWKPALADLDRAQQLDPHLASVDLARAHVLLDSGRPRAAVDSATRFLARQPRHADALIVRGRARARLGLRRDAADDFNRALDLRPAPDLYIERARTVAGTGTATVEAALHGLDQGIARLGPVVTLELEAIDLEERLGRYDSALARLARVSAQAARQESWLARRGAILDRAGRTAEARAAYREALNAAMNLPESTRRTRASAALIERLHKDLQRMDVERMSSARR